jgi:hypothetical protein
MRPHLFTRQPRITLGIVAVLLGLSCKGIDQPVAVEILASSPLTAQGGVHAILDKLFFALDISTTSPACSETGVAIFDTTIIQNTDTQRTLIADANNEANFAAFTHLLTDGVDEMVIRCAGLLGGGAESEGSKESSFFGRTSGSAPDFSGYTIDRVELQLDSASTTSPGSNQGHDGVWTDYYLRGRVVVWGHR